jgi:hypothetical protein
MTILEREMMYPGRGFPVPEQHHGGVPSGRPETLYSMLAAGRSLGKKVNIATTQQGALASFVNCLEVKGPDEAAMNLHLSLTPPKILPFGAPGEITNAQALDLLNRQAASGTLSNASAIAQNVSWARLIAVLEWGIGGLANDSVEVDIMNGLNVNVSASFLRVGVRFDQFPDLLGVPQGDLALYELGAFVGPGWAKQRNAQRSIQFPLLGPTGTGVNGKAAMSSIVPIPRYATSVRMIASAPSTFGQGLLPVLPQTGWFAQVIFYSSPGPGIGATPDITQSPVPNQVGAATVIDNGSAGLSIPIPNGAYFASVLNGTGEFMQPTLIFDLGI